ncbi:hypothetical protein HK097_007721 [Rhizophlyctis rosea]|uniref:Uncharacterized protein n=1 Tax=Rhizophlyctis rosea TaxID=64517 RepID=A0AAD5X4E3_9FUNG|nr:hypothetical protein HK097_007721 [Rhizophlyctis rosea]
MSASDNSFQHGYEQGTAALNSLANATTGRLYNVIDASVNWAIGAGSALKRKLGYGEPWSAPSQTPSPTSSPPRQKPKMTGLVHLPRGGLAALCVEPKVPHHIHRLVHAPPPALHAIFSAFSQSSDAELRSLRTYPVNFITKESTISIVLPTNYDQIWNTNRSKYWDNVDRLLKKYNSCCNILGGAEFAITRNDVVRLSTVATDIANGRPKMKQFQQSDKPTTRRRQLSSAETFLEQVKQRVKADKARKPPAQFAG